MGTSAFRAFAVTGAELPLPWPDVKLACRDAVRAHHHGNLAAPPSPRPRTRSPARASPTPACASVAERAGVSHTAVGKRFGDKAGLLAAVAAEGYRVLGDGFERLSADMLELGRAYVAFAVQRPGAVRGDVPADRVPRRRPGVVAARGRRPPRCCGRGRAAGRRRPDERRRHRRVGVRPRHRRAGARRRPRRRCRRALRAAAVLFPAGPPAVSRLRSRRSGYATAVPRPTRESRVAGMDRPLCRRPSGVSVTGIVRIRMTAARRPPADRPVGTAQARRRRRRVPGQLRRRRARPVRERLRPAVTAAGGLPVHLPQHVDPAATPATSTACCCPAAPTSIPRATAPRRSRRLDPLERDATPPSWRSSSWPSPTSCPCSASAAGCSCSTSGPAARCTRTCRPTPATTSLPTTRSTSATSCREHAGRCCTGRAPRQLAAPPDGRPGRRRLGRHGPQRRRHRSRPWSGRATTSSPCSGIPSCSPAPRPTRCSPGSSTGPGPVAGRRGLSRAPRPVVERRRRPPARRARRRSSASTSSARRRPRLRLDGRRGQRLPGRQRGPQPPRAHRAGRRRAVVHRVHRDVGAVGLGRDGVARAGHRRRHHEGHADRRRRHARATRPGRSAAATPPTAGSCGWRRRRPATR